MRLGIIGPTQWQKNCGIIGIKEKKYLEETKRLARIINGLGFEIVVNPHFGGISQIFAGEYKKIGGTAIGIIPKQDSEFGIDYLDQGVCAQTIDCGTWRNMAEKFNEETQAMLCLGFSSGVLNEIAFSKWFNYEKGKKKKILIIKEFVSAQLPKESVKDLDVGYVSMKQIEKRLKKLEKEIRG